MRQLRLVFARNGGLTTLLFAAVLPISAGCGGKEGSLSNRDDGNGLGGSSAGVGGASATGGDATGGNSATGGRPSTGGTAGGSSTTGGTGTGGSTSTGGTASIDWPDDPSTVDVPTDYPYGTGTVPSEQSDPTDYVNDMIVPLPAEGTRATPERLCAEASEAVKDSGWAARITLDVGPEDPRRTRGTIAIAPALADRVIGTPEVRVVELDEGLGQATLGTVATSAGVFTFALELSASPRQTCWDMPPRLVLETVFHIDCDGQRQPVRALTALYYCWDGENGGWASSGDHCIQCASVCEMVASPILPARTEDTMALAGALRLGLRVIGKVHGALVLLAEHDGGADDVEYHWQASGGRLAWVDRDVALWLPPEAGGPEVLQVAVTSAHAAAVASLRYGIAT